MALLTLYSFAVCNPTPKAFSFGWGGAALGPSQSAFQS